ncbi:MAG TPA: amino acid permease [Bacteroidales bacterium]|nr:amino acid permease [Bacteroidales bacterium]
MNEKLFRKKSISHILNSSNADLSNPQLKRNLTVLDLTALGVAGIVGAGIFSTIGNAAYSGGPAVSLLFVFTAIACGFSALCYAEFASRIPISGSAYTYAYASFGELVAWVIGWTLIMEYAVGNIAVAISWSDYFTGMMNGFGVKIPEFITTDYLSASRGFREACVQMAAGTDFDSLTSALQESYMAWTKAPQIAGLRLIGDIPAFSIVVLITVLVYIGIEETKIASNIMVLVKMIILLVVISVGAFYVNTDNWSPFAPNGLGGVLKGVSAVFFAYIGFDAISTTAEECKNPQKDLPRAMFYSLIICVVLYVAISLVLTGMVSYKELAVGDPLAFVFHKLNINWLSGIIAISAIFAMASVLLVFQVGQPRIWMSMSRDGLLPKRFGKVHKKFHTPSFSTVITGLFVALPTLFLNLTEVTDLTSIGTLFAFIVVCAGILIVNRDEIQSEKGNEKKGFRVPYYNSKLFLPPIVIIIIIALICFNLDGLKTFFSGYKATNIPMYGFLICASYIVYISVKRSLSLIPVLGLLINMYLITELGIANWMRFLIWLIIGIIIYFTYGIKNSKLKNYTVNE